MREVRSEVERKKQLCVAWSTRGGSGSKSISGSPAAGPSAPGRRGCGSPQRAEWGNGAEGTQTAVYWRQKARADFQLVPPLLSRTPKGRANTCKFAAKQSKVGEGGARPQGNEDLWPRFLRAGLIYKLAGRGARKVPDPPDLTRAYSAIASGEDAAFTHTQLLPGAKDREAAGARRGSAPLPWSRLLSPGRSAFAPGGGKGAIGPGLGPRRAERKRLEPAGGAS